MGKVVNVECALRDIFHVSHRLQNLKGILLYLYIYPNLYIRMSSKLSFSFKARRLKLYSIF